MQIKWGVYTTIINRCGVRDLQTNNIVAETCVMLVQPRGTELVNILGE